MFAGCAEMRAAEGRGGLTADLNRLRRRS
jgi:hypothetical protein